MTRFRIPLLSAALLFAAVAGAQGFPIATKHLWTLYFYKTIDDVDVSTSYSVMNTSLGAGYKTDAPEPASDSPTDPGLRLVDGEIFRVLAVYGSAAVDSDSIPFAIDATGAVVGLGSDYEAEWATWGEGDETLLAVQGVPGIPVALKDDGSPNTVVVSCPVKTAKQYVTLYLVTYDTRTPDASGEAWQASGTTVARYGVARLASSSSIMGSLGNVAIAVGERASPRDDAQLAYGNPAPVRPTAALTSYVDENGQTIKGDDLAALVTPTLDASDAEGGSLTVVPSGGLPLYRYAVETSDSLGGEWELLDDWVAREGITGTAPLGYSAIMPDGKTPLVLPRKEGETSRFYRLVAPGK